MNLFYLDRDPEKAARALHDQHVVKMVLESAQIVCTALQLHGWTRSPYRATHQYHPIVQWAANGRLQFLTVIRYGLAIAHEYTRRYERIHKSQAVLESAMEQHFRIPRARWTEPPQCMPEAYRGPDVTEAYRRYYLAEKVDGKRWTNSQLPKWEL